MNRITTRLPNRIAPGRAPDAPAPKWRRRAAWAGTGLLLVLLAWWLWPDGRLARARELRAELFSDAGRNLSPEERRAKFGEMRQTMANLSPQQRDELGKEMMQRRLEQLRRYAQLPPAEKRQALDRDIARQEQMRQRMQANGGQRGGGPNGGPGPGMGPGGPRGGPRTPEERERARQRRLDSTTPEFRALTDQYRKDLEARRQQRGLPPAPGFGRGPR